MRAEPKVLDEKLLKVVKLDPAFDKLKGENLLDEITTKYKLSTGRRVLGLALFR
jgi:hypothetical protein